MEKIENLIPPSRLNMASYGFGKFLNEFIEMAFTSWLYFYYVRAIGLDILLVGSALVIYGIWNAINDPLIGYLTNRPLKFAKKWGRRKPWILIGGIPWILSYILVFIPPIESEQWVIFLWLVFSTCLYDVFGTIFFVNFSSLFPDKFRSVRERRLATGIQTPIGVIGVALGAILPPIIIKDYAVASLYILNAGVVIIIGLIVFGISIPGYREDPVLVERFLNKDREQEKFSFFKSLKNSLRLRSFLVFIIVYTLYRCLVISMQSSIPFFVEFVLGETSTTQTLLSAGFLIGALISSPLWAYLAQKTNNNKKIMLINGFLLTFFTVPLVFLENVTTVFIIMLLWGFGLGGFWTMISPVLADIIDDSIVTYHKREEGVYNGIQQFFGRLGLLFQAVTFTIVHLLTGFNEGAGLESQPSSAIWGIHVHFALIPAIVMGIATLIFWAFYKLTPEKVTANQEKVIELGL